MDERVKVVDRPKLPDDFITFTVHRWLVDMMRVRKKKTGEPLIHQVETAVKWYLEGKDSRKIETDERGYYDADGVK
jgi:hypothetical protein